MSKRRRFGGVGIAGGLALVLCGGIAAAEETTSPAEPRPAAQPVRTAPPAEPGSADADGVTVGAIRGSRVNVRVGPRVDHRPVMQLHDGDVVVIVERVPGWVGVRIPQGMPVAVSAKYLRSEGDDAVRVIGRELNLRVEPPRKGRPMPGAFRDHPAYDSVLPLVERVVTEEGDDWAWVVAPEGIRAYVSAPYVRELGPAAECAEVLDGARATRRDWIRRLAAERRTTRVREAEVALREAMGVAQERLHRLRLEAGWERHPVVDVAGRLDQALERTALAPAPLRQVARALREDLESELTLRVARRDAAVARARGLEPDPEKLPAPQISQVTLTGVLRWESVPNWRAGGAWILWVDDKPTHVVELTTGMPLPHPKLADHAGRSTTFKGHQPGRRLFGLPVIELAAIE